MPVSIYTLRANLATDGFTFLKVVKINEEICTTDLGGL